MFESFAHVPVTEELLRHVWEGEPNGHQGGHRYGLGREGKTEFPQEWDLQMVSNSIFLTLRSPQAVKFQGDFVRCLRQVGEVVVAVMLIDKGSGLELHTAFPVCGTGVSRNDRGLSTPLPLDLSVLET